MNLVPSFSPLRFFFLLLLVGMGTHASSARAEGPELVKITLGSDGTFKARMALPYPIAKVRKVLQDPITSTRLSPDVLKVQSAKKGDCDQLVTTVRGAFRPLVYEAMRCPTSSGWRAKLLKTDGDFNDYQAAWSLVPDAAGSGTEVEYQIKIDVDLPFPDAMVQANVRKSVQNTMNALKKAVAVR